MFVVWIIMICDRPRATLTKLNALKMFVNVNKHHLCIRRCKIVVGFAVVISNMILYLLVMES